MPGRLGCAPRRGLLMDRKKNYFISGCFKKEKTKIMMRTLVWPVS